MSEEEVTVVQEPTEPITKKDPKKVEQGKRLAMISKEAKERKMRAKIEKENKESKSYLSYAPIAISVISTTGLLITMYLLFKGNSKEENKPSQRKVSIEDEKPQTNTNKKNINKKFEEL